MRFWSLDPLIVASARDPKHNFRAKLALPKSAADKGGFPDAGDKRWITENRKITIVRKDRKHLRSATARCESKVIARALMP
jgi:hypothetical protein